MQGKWRGGNVRKGIGLDTDCVVVGGFFFFPVFFSIVKK
jgi:hypothetical protein